MRLTVLAGTRTTPAGLFVPLDAEALLPPPDLLPLPLPLPDEDEDDFVALAGRGSARPVTNKYCCEFGSLIIR